MVELRHGDRIWSADYGPGVVQISNELMLGILWDDPRLDGRRFLEHQPAFARWLQQAGAFRESSTDRRTRLTSLRSGHVPVECLKDGAEIVSLRDVADRRQRGSA